MTVARPAPTTPAAGNSPVPLVRPIIGRAEIAAVNRVLRSGQIAQGACVAQFETGFAAMCGVREAIAVNSGTAALFIALLAHGIGPGDEVITSPFTFAATANAIIMTGATPVFADIRETDFNIDPVAIPARITPRTKAIIPVHLYGHPADMTRISDLAASHRLALIEDACQAHGAEWQGRRVGSFGTGCFSFYPTKNITTGEGGMVTTNDPQIAQRLRRLRSHGADRAYYHTELGYNFRMTDISAAIGLAQLGRLDTFTRKRRANARYYDAHLRGVIIPVELDGARHVYHQYTVRVPEGRDVLQAKLADQGIGSAVYYPVPLHQQPYYRELGYADSLPVAEAMARQVLSLPIWPGLTAAQRERVARTVSELTS